MNKKIKVSCILFTAVVIIFFISLSVAYPDSPGVSSPGSRVPPRSAKAANVKKKAAPARAISKPANPAPAPAAPKPAETDAVNALNEAVSLIKQERYKKATKYILCAVKEQPRNADAWYWFGVWSDRTGNFSNAQKYYTKALEIDPQYPALSRIVVYPRDPYDKNPLWDTIRPPVIETIFPIDGLIAAASDSMESPGDYDITEIPMYRPPKP
ncbi:MAG: tetratricopeptide repeat protein [Synergistaceae bacterium]|nr:tetratricopeptide repeat protein [Synergistaceae bacterium]